jgi:Uma2 family endonuclease
LVWEVDPKNRTVEVFTAADQSTRLNQNQTLDGGNVLPGFTLSLSQLFGELDRQGNG